MNKIKVNEQEQLAEDIGFGKRFSGTGRMLNTDGSFNIERKGAKSETLYQHFIYSKSRQFLLEIILYFLIINLIFAYLYYKNGVEYLNIKPVHSIQDYFNCFFFSIQTFTSVGYGFLNPQNNIANTLASINALLGLLSLAVVTGIIFVRFSKSKATIAFSKNILIAPLNGDKTIQFRIVNESASTLINMECAATLTWLEKINDVNRRKFERLKLELNYIYLFPLNWTLVHKIDNSSPLFNKSMQEIIEQNFEFLIMLKGYDDTYDQNIFKNYSYHTDDIIENAIFETMYESKKDTTILHIEKLNNYKKL